MSNRYLLVVLAACLVSPVLWVRAQLVKNAEIVEYRGNEIAWTNDAGVPAGKTYRIEWAHTLTSGGAVENWSSDYSAFSAGAITGGVMSARIPMFFRVVNIDADYPNEAPEQTNTGLTVTGRENSAFDLSLDEILGTFVDPNGQPVRFLSVTGGSLRLVYDPGDYVGNDTLEFLVSDGLGGVATGRVNLVIDPNAAPMASNDVVWGFEDAATNLQYLLANDSDPDVDVLGILSYTQPATNGSVVWVSTNTVGWDVLLFTPSADYNGTNTFSYVVLDEYGLVGFQSTGQVDVVVQPVNDAPSFTNGGAIAIGEDAGEQVVSDWAVDISAGPANEAFQQLAFSTTNGVPDFFSAPPAVDATNGTLSFTVAADSNSADGVVIDVWLVDDDTAGGAALMTATQQFTITVSPSNDMPSFATGDDQTVGEDTGEHNIPAWATSISDGDAETAQSLTFHLTNSLPTLFSVQPTVSSGGTLSYTPADNTNGEATVWVALQDDATAGGPALTTEEQSFTITVSPSNDVPTFTAGGDQTVDEDAGAQSVSDWATGIDDGDLGVDQALTFIVTNSNEGLFGALPEVSSGGTLTYTPASNANGSATVYVRLQDDATAGGPALTTEEQTFVITVNPANDVPTFTSGGNQTVDEDAGAQTVASWAMGIDDGDTDVDQSLVFLANNSNEGLFEAQPAVSTNNGTLTYTPAANANGSATVYVRLQDDATAGGPALVSATQQFVITVNPVNDSPVGADGTTTMSEDTTNNITLYGYDVDGDSLAWTNVTVSVGTVDNAGVSNVFQFVPPADYAGTAYLYYRVSDLQNEVNSTSEQYTVTITVSNVNDAPILGADAEMFHLQDTNGVLTLNVLTNDLDLESNMFGIDSSAFSGLRYGYLTNGGVNAAGWTNLVYVPTNGIALETFHYVVTDILGARSTGTVNVTVGNLYAWIDVSGGPSASSYPVVFTNRLPAGWPDHDDCRTTHILFRYIPKGSFLMGSPTGECYRPVDSSPLSEAQSTKTLPRGFYMGVFEITQQQYTNVAGVNLSSNRTGNLQLPAEGFSYTAFRGSPYDAATPPGGFLATLNGRLDGCTADLPTDIEWEYACRAGETGTFHNGVRLVSPLCTCDTDPAACSAVSEIAWTSENSSGSTHTVGSLEPNAWGLYDMHGNVREFTRTIGDFILCYVRGGTYAFPMAYARSAYRPRDYVTVAYPHQGARMTLHFP